MLEEEERGERWWRAEGLRAHACVFELAQHMTNLFCDTNQQLHTTTTSIPLGKRHSDMLTCSAVPGLAVLGRSKPGIIWCPDLWTAAYHWYTTTFMQLSENQFRFFSRILTFGFWKCVPIKHLEWITDVLECGSNLLTGGTLWTVK